MDNIKINFNQNNNIEICPCCKKEMKYCFSTGVYSCDTCKLEKRDLYGKLRDLIEENPNLNKIALSCILDISLKELSKYIKDGYLINPKI